VAEEPDPELVETSAGAPEREVLASAGQAPRPDDVDEPPSVSTDLPAEDLDVEISRPPPRSRWLLVLAALFLCGSLFLGGGGVVTALVGLTVWATDQIQEPVVKPKPSPAPTPKPKPNKRKKRRNK
jgi:hypothetical protein